MPQQASACQPPCVHRTTHPPSPPQLAASPAPPASCVGWVPGAGVQDINTDWKQPSCSRLHNNQRWDAGPVHPFEPAPLTCAAPPRAAPAPWPPSPLSLPRGHPQMGCAAGASRCAGAASVTAPAAAGWATAACCCAPCSCCGLGACCSCCSPCAAGPCPCRVAGSELRSGKHWWRRLPGHRWLGWRSRHEQLPMRPAQTCFCCESAAASGCGSSCVSCRPCSCCESAPLRC